MNFNIEDDIEIEEKVHNFDDVEAMSAIENEIEVMTALIKKSKGPELDFYKTKLENYSRSVAAATTKYEADALVREFETRLPDHTISLRKAREESLGDRVSLYEVHGEVVRNALRRGERLPSLQGPARIEDPLTALIKTSQSLARRMSAVRSR